MKNNNNKNKKKRKKGCMKHGDPTHFDLLYAAWQNHRQDELKLGKTNDDEQRLHDYNSSSVSSGNWVFPEVWSFPCQAQKIEAIVLQLFADYKIGSKKEYYYRHVGKLDIFLEMRTIIQSLNSFFNPEWKDTGYLDLRKNHFQIKNYGPKNQSNFFNIIDEK